MTSHEAAVCRLCRCRHNRHSYAAHLLRRGTPLKTLGDQLGHRAVESTCVYLRLATGDLRRVALSLPRHGAQETQP